MTQPLEVLTKLTADAFRAYMLTDATDDLRRAASYMVDAREQFLTKDGRPDYAGRTFAYRAWTREAISAASVPEADVSRVLAAARYHVSNVLRERLNAEELESYGLRAAPARERSVEKRAAEADLRRIAEGARPLTSDEDIERAVEVLEHIARRLDAGDAGEERRADWATRATSACGTIRAALVTE